MPAKPTSLTENYDQYVRLLYEIHYDKLRGYFLGKTGNVSDAEEGVQEVFFRFLRYMEKHQWKMEIESVDAYLMRIAVNICNDKWAAKKKATFFSYDDEKNETLQHELTDRGSAIEHIERQLYFEGLYHELHLYFVDLTKREELLIFMHCVEEKTFKEIAEILDENACEVRYETERALCRLRYRVKQHIKRVNRGEGAEAKGGLGL